MDNITLNKIPSVNGKPQEGQSRIKWIVNGDLLLGAENLYSDDGNLNEASSQIQDNILTLESNDYILLGELNRQDTEINHIKEIINDASDLSLIDQVTNNTIDIEENKKAIADNSESIILNTKQIDEAIAVVGKRVLEDGERTAFGDLEFIKTNIGNKVGFDINGNPDDEIVDPSGIYKNIDDITTQVLLNVGDISSIKDQLNNADLGALEENVSNILTYIGDKPSDNDKPIYNRLGDIDLEIVGINSDITEIKESIGDSNINNRLSTLELDVAGNIDNIKTNTTDISKNTDDILDLNNRYTEVNGSLSDVIGIVGESADLGIQGRLSTVERTIGQEENPDNGTINFRLVTLEGNDETNTAKIQDIEVQVGDINNVVVPKVNSNTTSINGNPSATNEVEKAGLMQTTKALYSSNTNIVEAINSIISKYNYSGKSFSLLTDKTVDSSKNISAAIASKINSTDSNNSVYSPDGISSILADNLFVDAIKSDVVLINVGTYDYFFDTPLGSIADAVDSYDGDVSFYNLVYKLLNQAVLSPSNPRVFITNGIVLESYTGSTVVYPNANSVSKTLSDYSTAIDEVAELFNIPVLYTIEELGISLKNMESFSSGNGLNTSGESRLLNYVAGSINSK